MGGIMTTPSTAAMERAREVLRLMGLDDGWYTPDAIAREIDAARAQDGRDAEIERLKQKLAVQERGYSSELMRLRASLSEAVEVIAPFAKEAARHKNTPQQESRDDERGFLRPGDRPGTPGYRQAIKGSKDGDGCHSRIRAGLARIHL